VGGELIPTVTGARFTCYVYGYLPYCPSGEETVENNHNLTCLQYLGNMVGKRNLQKSPPSPPIEVRQQASGPCGIRKSNPPLSAMRRKVYFFSTSLI